jgi:peroxiredoxin
MNTTLLLLSACLAAEPAAAMKTLDVGDDAAAVSAVDRKGKPLSLAELQRGEKDKKLPVVLTFWCSFCHSCRHMEKDLDKLAAEYKGRAKVYALDASADTEELIDEAVKKAGLTLPILIDADGKIADSFGATKTTTTVILDARGRVAYLGQFADQEHPYAREALDDLLAGRPVKTTHTTPKG